MNGLGNMATVVILESVFHANRGWLLLPFGDNERGNCAPTTADLNSCTKNREGRGTPTSINVQSPCIEL
jgi:hypothetical protein